MRVLVQCFGIFLPLSMIVSFIQDLRLVADQQLTSSRGLAQRGAYWAFFWARILAIFFSSLRLLASAPASVSSM